MAEDHMEIDALILKRVTYCSKSKNIVIWHIIISKYSSTLAQKAIFLNQTSLLINRVEAVQSVAL